MGQVDPSVEVRMIWIQVRLLRNLSSGLDSRLVLASYLQFVHLSDDAGGAVMGKESEVSSEVAPESADDRKKDFLELDVSSHI